jgi:hypothetical protein
MKNVMASLASEGAPRGSRERREGMKTKAVVAMLRVCTVVAVLAAIPLLAGVATAQQ